MNVINLFENKNLIEAKSQKNYHKSYVDISDVWKSKKLGFHLSIIEPKNFSYPYHFHSAEEELFLILEGEAVIRCQNQFKKVKAGDLIFYPTGSEYAHNLYNCGEIPVRILAVSNIDDENDICEYPDSYKISTPEGFQQNGITVNYFKDEENPAQYWPENVLKGEVE